MCVLITAAGATVSWPVNYILNSSSLILMPCAAVTTTTTTTTTAPSCALKQIKDSFRTALSLRSLARSLVHLIHLFSYLWTISSVQCPPRETSLNFAFVNVLLVIVKLGFYIANATHALPHSLTHSQSANSTFGPFAVAVAISQQLNSFYSQSAAAAATTNVCIYININWFCPCDKLETCSILHLRRCPFPRSVPRLVAHPWLQRSIQSGLGPSFFLSDDSLSLGQFYLLVRTFSVCSLRLLI